MNSIWLTSTETTNFPTLNKDISAEVCIIGAGITGINLAYMLSKQGISVALVDKSKICSSVTAHTTGKVTSQHGLIYNYLINSYGKETAKKYLYTNENAIQDMAKIITSEKIECDYEAQSSFIYTNNENELEKIHLEISALNSLNYPAYFCNNLNLPFKTLGGICFPNQAQINARKYCLGLTKAIPTNSIFENTKVIDIKKYSDNYITICENNSTIKSKYVVIATHYPIINFPGLYFLKMYQDKSYIIAVDTKKELFDGMYLSAENPVTSFRTTLINGKRLLLVGGSGHKTGKTNINIQNSYINLENYIKQFYPESEIIAKWSTEDCVTLDKIPYIGQFSNFLPNLFVATGYKKWGMTSSFVAATSIFNDITNKQNEQYNIYKATRMEPIKNRKEIGNILKETSYSLILNKLKRPIISYNELKIGDGGIVSFNGKKLGIYKKSETEIYAVKPYCTHLGCQLSWNPLEKTWDCPCHGSRYMYNGELLTEPSKKNLEKVDIFDNKRI